MTKINQLIGTIYPHSFKENTIHGIFLEFADSYSIFPCTLYSRDLTNRPKPPGIVPEDQKTLPCL
jgi:hypothetical protein